jgi:hypothetical protein
MAATPSDTHIYFVCIAIAVKSLINYAIASSCSDEMHLRVCVCVQLTVASNYDRHLMVTFSLTLSMFTPLALYSLFCVLKNHAERDKLVACSVVLSDATSDAYEY